jgi:hypothetical protein
LIRYDCLLIDEVCLICCCVIALMCWCVDVMWRPSVGMLTCLCWCVHDCIYVRCWCVLQWCVMLKRCTALCKGSCKMKKKSDFSVFETVQPKFNLRSDHGSTEVFEVWARFSEVRLSEVQAIFVFRLSDSLSTKTVQLLRKVEPRVGLEFNLGSAKVWLGLSAIFERFNFNCWPCVTTKSERTSVELGPNQQKSVRLCKNRSNRGFDSSRFNL